MKLNHNQQDRVENNVMNNLILCALTFLTVLQAPGFKCDTVIVTRTIYVATSVCPCEYNFNPVCGSDGITYMNGCLLDCASDENVIRKLTPIAPLDESKCSDCVCQNIDLPVCTLDGVTYPNECELSCENRRRIQQNQPIIYLAYRSACKGPPCGCDTITSPVCGTDNTLYRNQCVLDCAIKNAEGNGLQPFAFQNVGACSNGCLCPNKNEPVCGSNGLVYDNLCLLACQNKINTNSNYRNVTIANRNICDNCKCPNKIEIVCGSDGNMVPRTYQNQCTLECDAKRLNNPYLKMISKGACPKCYCKDVYSPVCGTNYQTYRNLCELRCANDDLPKDKDPIGLSNYGECVNNYCDCSYCPADHEPMCGSDKSTYWNMCWLECKSNCNKKQLLPEISMISKGYCSA